jgi:diguanylate cyclase (GGDEF)-like protein
MIEPQLLRSIFQDSADPVVILNPNRTVKTINPAFRKGIDGAQVDVDFMDLVAPEARDPVLARLVQAAGGETVVVDVLHGLGNDRTVRVEYRFFPIDDGMVAGFGRFRDDDGNLLEELGRKEAQFQEQKRLLDEIQLELTQVPFIDPITGVWNRMQVIERLTGEWSRMERYGSPVSCLMVDVEDLVELRRRDPVAADETLKAVARRLKAVVRDHDIVGRFGGDRFVVVAVQADADGARSLSRRLLEIVAGEPIATERHTTPVNLRIGGATNRSAGVEILEDLFSVAEEALEEARRSKATVKVAEELHV